MTRLYRANMVRFLKSIYFIGGCLIALTFTFAVTTNTICFPFLEELDISRRMFFVTAAMVAFFTVFVPVFTNADYSDGVIRNKMIAGFTQKEILFSFYLSYASLAFIMWIFYLIGGILGGAEPFGAYLVPNLVFLVALLGFVAVILVLSFRLRKTVAAVIAAGLLFQTCFTMVMFGNLMLMLAEDKLGIFPALIYNVNVLGQWFSLSGFADEVSDPGAALQLLISLAVIAVMAFVGSFKLNSRDVV